MASKFRPRFKLQSASSIVACRKAHTKPRLAAPTAEEYRSFRLESLKSSSLPSYPRYSPSDYLIQPSEFSNRFDKKFESGEWGKDLNCALAGRIISRRDASKKLVFLDVQRDGQRTQIILKRDDFSSKEEFAHLLALVKEGDHIECVGYPGRSPAGELSLVARSLVLLAPCLHRVPKSQGLADTDTRFRARYLDLMANKKPLEIFRKRAKAIQYIREYLTRKGFLEVETPILGIQAGGANARPFITSSNTLGSNMFLRIAPELYLKQLVIGGVQKVFEIGKQFRNEGSSFRQTSINEPCYSMTSFFSGIDTTHNPEFTTCELYEAYQDLENVMNMTEDLISGLVTSVQGKPQLLYTIHDAEGQAQTVELDFSPPFARLDVITALQSVFGQLPNLADTSSIPELLALCKTHDIYVTTPHTLPRILDKMISTVVEPLCEQPTFLTNHPVALSPLAKRLTPTSDTVSRFELFVMGKELANAYEELNDPAEQLERFQTQAADKALGDDEAQDIDKSFVEALEYGLPPTTGWGLGIDRLCMLLAGEKRIREVITFPLLAPKASDKQSE
ncbi:hypothetical protein DFS34DRAFT_172920 [Phlyctochytrium arcticum]|nr:hypothetical protein DFS34DRAFT_172920 [Phlyctochytrium arcticum]